MYQSDAPSDDTRRPQMMSLSGVPYPYPRKVYPDAAPVVEDFRLTAVRLRVPFGLPAVSGLPQPQPTETETYSTENNTAFDVFLTVPTRLLVDDRRKADHLLIMLNGFEEIVPSHSWLYDELGQALAHHGIVSLLLPTPYHLNRTPMVNDNRTKTSLVQVLHRPVRFLNAEPASIYPDFLQTFRELDFLATIVKESDASSHDPYALFHQLFDGRTKISLLGYSLGGYRVLARIMTSDQFHRCILLCSGGSLDSLRPPDLRDEWEAIARKIIGKSHTDAVVAAAAAAATDDLTLIDTTYWIFQPNWTLGTQEAVKKLAEDQRLKCIVGVRDKVMEVKAVNRLLEAGVELESVPGMGHILRSDVAFERGFLRIAASIAGFVAQDYPPDEMTLVDIRDQMLNALKNRVPDRGSVHELADLARLDPEVRRLYVMSKGRFQSDSVLLDHLARELKNRNSPTPA